jgi:hypothetical protein
MIFIDEPNWPGHGRLWSHLISDTSFAELHDFAAGVGLRPGAFDQDHYDVPAELFADCLAAGAQQRRSRELVALLTGAGLRRRKRSRLAR